MKALFLDRDGVINQEKRDSYIFHKDEMQFYDGALEAITQAQKYFDLILVVTNQRGIGRGLMTETDLMAIHDYLQEKLKAKGGKIDAFYFATATDNNHPMRKPNTGMALQAKEDFPEIDFSASVMIGNNISDMEFGKKMGMKTVFLHTTQEEIPLPHHLIDTQFDSLISWIQSISK
ncbi:MAG TPA: HAD family hydrolase [Edaphocola sp.]|nr:HAD family hydrolase [Edaphocola sp.]